MMKEVNPDTCIWFLGASFEQKGDQAERFLKDGIWETENPDPRVLENIAEIPVGAWVAIKSVYTRKNNLPFDSKGNSISVMLVKALGKVQENQGAGRLRVDWFSHFKNKEW